MRLGLLGVLVLAGCSASVGEPAPDASVPDSGDEPDASSQPDASQPDAAAPDASTPDAGTTTLVASVTDHGVTWTFDRPSPVGRFVTGEYYVVGSVTVAAIDPPPGPGRNGSVRNLLPTNDQSPWDDRVEANRWDPAQRVAPPLTLAPGDALLSSISVSTPGLVENWLREGNNERSLSPVKSISILTCLAAAPPADAFRPAWADRAQVIYRLGQVNRALLPGLAPPSAVDPVFLATLADRLGRPWVDNLFYGFDAQVDSMPMYGREHGRVSGLGSLLLMLDLPPALEADQERLLVGYLQRAIDLWGLVKSGYYGWYAHGGHGSGRKWPIIFAGMLLSDAAMREPSRTWPAVRFGEDMHTTSATAAPWGPAWWTNGGTRSITHLYSGHMGLWGGQPVSTTAGWGPYEHLEPAQWASSLGESYRRCCTSIAWVGQALAARRMGAQQYWGHDPFFDYVDRWMDPAGDAAYAQEIFTRTGWDFRANWAAQGQTWDRLVNELWARYR